MKHRKLVLAGAMASLLGFSSMVFAQAEAPIIGRGTQMFSGFAGGQWFDIRDQIDQLGGDVQTELNLGARYQYNVSPHVGLELNFMYSPAQNEFFGPTGAGIGSSDFHAMYYMGNLVYNIAPNSNVIPFLTGGLGAVTIRVDEGENPDLDSSSTKFGGNVGAGLLWALNERFGLRFEARDYIYRVDEQSPQFRHAFDIPAGFEETVHDIAVTGGFTIIF